MKSKMIYIAAAVCMLALCFAFYQTDVEKDMVRTHQHKEKEKDADTMHLPIIKIETGAQKIPGIPFLGEDGEIFFETSESGGDTVTCPFGIIDGEEGNNSVTDELTDTSLAQIRYRGNSSRFFDKKSYSIHLVDKEGSENPLALSGMAQHDEWVLNGPFLDRTLLRNYLCLNVSGEIMEYAPNVRYCELYVDGEYQGLYLLMESVSRGKNRINISKPERNRDLTSYIVRWDRAGKGDHEIDNYTYYTYRSDVSALDVRYPGKNQITPGRMQYIEDDISKVEKILYSRDLTDSKKGASSVIDYNSFAEYFVINEFFRNVDAGRFSTFYYKDTRGKLKACVWDFNNSCDNYIDYVWDKAGFTMQDAPWFGELLKDRQFVDAVVDKYRRLRGSYLSEEYLSSYVDETVEWLGSAVDRNYEKWGYVFDISEYSGMTYLTPASRNDLSYEQSVDRLKTFLVERGSWLDAHIDTLYQYCHDSKNVNLLIN